MKKFVALMAVFAVLAPTMAYAQEEVTKDTLLRANTDTLMKHVRILSSSQYEGRMAGSEAFLDAANYCAEVLASYGVKPFQEEWGQYFQVEYNEIENCNFYTYVNDNDVRVQYVLGRDYVCSSMTGRGYTNAPVVFCGWGIDHHSFDEYGKVDVRGKVVLCLSGVPEFLPGKITDRYATLRDKAEVARKHGAVGLVCVNMSESCRPYEVQHWAWCGEGAHQMTFPVVQPTRDMATALLADEQMTFDSVVNRLAETMTPQSFHLRKSFEININAKYHPNATTANVVGVLPGYDAKLRNEYIVVGAHLDHVGIQGNTCLFPGANDNATGVAAVLEAARLLTVNAPKEIEYNKRSIVFVLFSGGELQNLGSSIFVSNFPKLRNVECFINAESIGQGDSIQVLGNKRFPQLWSIASRNDSISTKSLVKGYRTMPKGDAAPFAQVGIPSLVFTGFMGNMNDHVPSDISENVDRDLMTKNASLMAEVIYELSLGDYQGRSQRSRRFEFDE
ncbi:MAG: M28 family peptidase [Bacteroidales bacterium]|nr:M28 family peptidase [Bacteroidales bacterium]